MQSTTTVPPAPDRRESISHRGLPLKLLVILTLTTLCAVIAFGVHECFDTQRELERELTRDAEANALRLAHSLSYPLQTGDDAAAARILRAEFGTPDLVYAAVRAVPDGRVVIALERAESGEIRRRQDQLVNAALVRSSRPIVGPEAEAASGGSLGEVEVALTPAATNDRLQRAFLRDLGEFLVLGLVLIVPLGLVLQHCLVRPLELIRHAMDRARRHLGSGSQDTPHAVEVIGQNPVLPAPHAFSELRAMGETFEQMVADIVERRRALMANEENLRITLESIGEGVIATNAEGIVTRLNRVASRLTGVSPQEACGQPLESVLKIIDASTRLPLVDAARRTLTSILDEPVVRSKLLVSSDGSECPVEDSGAPIRDAQGQMVGTVIVFRDVTEHNRLEEQVRHAQRLDSIGQLAGGVAHDFNNMLTGILGNAELLGDYVSGDEEAEGCVVSIRDAARRAAELTGKLLTFSRKSEVMAQPVPMHRVINDTLTLLKRSIDKRIEIVSELGARDMVVEGDLSLLQNAVLNLGVNARDAMPDGGTLRVHTENIDLDEEYCRASGFELRPGPHLVLTVADTGTGMSKAVQERVFEPFFTTKDRHRGTGMGLAVVYGTVKQHHGSIVVYTELGQGSEFHVYLPVVSEDRRPSLAKHEPVLTGTGCILLVDDEQVVRVSAERLLRKLGYRIVVAEDGEEAVELYRRHRETIDLVLLDMIMPRMDGEQASREILRLDPAARVLVSSGFTRHTRVSELLKAGVLGFVKKPYTRAELGRAIAEALRGRAESIPAPPLVSSASAAG